MPVPSVVVTAPVLEMLKSVEVAEAVEEPIAKRVVLVSPLLEWMPNLANGEEVPTPMEPVVGRVKETLVVVAGKEPKRMLPSANWLFAVAEGKNICEPMPMLLPPVVSVVLVVPYPRRVLPYPVVTL